MMRRPRAAMATALTYALQPICTAALSPANVRGRVASRAPSAVGLAAAAGSSSSSSSSSSGPSSPHPPSSSSAGLGPLVDVDCNLLHPDLISFAQKIHGDGDDDGSGAFPPELEILRHPSMAVGGGTGVAALLSPSSTVAESERSFGVLSSDGARSLLPLQLRTTVGVHPYHAGEDGPPTAGAIGRLRALVEADRIREAGPELIAAVGEAGLDYSDGFPPSGEQIPWLEAQLDLAHELGLPLFVHERMAFDDVLRLIDEAAERNGESNSPPIIVHCFTGSGDECREYVRRGYHLSVSGYICKDGEGPEEVRRCLREGILPVDRLMVETDSPYMGFGSCRDALFGGEEAGAYLASLKAKKRKNILRSTYPNVPSSLPMVVRAAAESINEGRAARGEDPVTDQEVAKATTLNAIGFFGFERPGHSAN